MAINEGQLDGLFTNFETSPFLFVGSGISKRYLGTPNWEGLLSAIASDVRDSNFAYASYKSSCVYKRDDDLFMPQIATDIEKDYNHLWYTSPLEKWKSERENFIQQGMREDISPFKFCVAQKCNLELINDPQLLLEVDLLKQLASKHVSGIITTNYDGLMERIFPDFQVYIGQDDMIISSTQGIGEIYKIHGCCTAPHSIVINKEDYEAFHARSVYLAAKLLTTFVERPIVFIGYGLGDQNIKTILNSIVGGVSPKHLSQLEKRLIYVNHVDDTSLERITCATREYENGTLPMTQIDLCDYGQLYKALRNGKFKISTRLLKHIKESVSELILTSSPTASIKVIGLDDDTNIENVEFVAGVGVVTELAKNGMVGLKAQEIYEDILTNSLCERIGFDPSYLLYEGLPNMLANGPLPIWKYINLAKSKKELPKRILARKAKEKCIHDFRITAVRNQIRLNTGKTSIWRSENYTIPMLQKEMGSALKCIPHIVKLKDELIRKDDLFAFLQDVLRENPNILYTACSEFKKLIRLYDFLEYKEKGDAPAI